MNAMLDALKDKIIIINVRPAGLSASSGKPSKEMVKVGTLVPKRGEGGLESLANQDQSLKSDNFL